MNKNKNPYRRTICKFSSVKNKQTVNAHSSLMRDLFYLLEFDAGVISYTTQTQTLFYAERGEFKPFRFDLSIERRDVNQMAFIETNVSRYSPAVFGKVKTACEQKNFGFIVFSEEAIRAQPFLDSVKLLDKYARQNVSSEYYIALYKFFTTNQASLLEDLQVYFRSNNLNPSVIFTLIFNKHITADLTKPLTEQTVIRAAASCGEVMVI